MRSAMALFSSSVLSWFLIGFRFPSAQASDSITVGAIGDVLLHQELAVQALQYGYESLWAPMIPLMRKPDIMYANFEGTAAPAISIGAPKNADEAVTSGCHEADDPGDYFDGFVYTGVPRFNYHPKLATALVTSGVDFVSTANNHAFDRCELGVKRTIDSLSTAGLPHAGTRKNASRPFYEITTANNFSVAWISCVRIVSFGAQMPWVTNTSLIMTCEKDDVAALVKSLSARPDVNAVIVTPHWGLELSDVFEWQREWAHAWLDAGAAAILGNHPHIVQEAEDYITLDGRKTFVIYSIGNFVSHCGWHGWGWRASTSVFLQLRLNKTKENKAVVDEVLYVPTVTVRTKVEPGSSDEWNQPSIGIRCPAPFGVRVPEAEQFCDQFTAWPVTFGSESSSNEAALSALNLNVLFSRSSAKPMAEVPLPPSKFGFQGNRGHNVIRAIV